MVKHFQVDFVINFFCLGLKMTKLDFFIFSDNLLAISQL